MSGGVQAVAREKLGVLSRGLGKETRNCVDHRIDRTAITAECGFHDFVLETGRAIGNGNPSLRFLDIVPSTIKGAGRADHRIVQRDSLSLNIVKRGRSPHRAQMIQSSRRRFIRRLYRFLVAASEAARNSSTNIRAVSSQRQACARSASALRFQSRANAARIAAAKALGSQ
jgi:hypothetical protein